MAPASGVFLKNFGTYVTNKFFLVKKKVFFPKIKSFSKTIIGNAAQ